ncbi:uncharacterized protein N0V96_010935 [Colletotrichum fioriniae]|uniref:uncharacterized protein n=1 Tax=Colletotrichum fioriniae TaxID=710243 RepID=UPI0032DA5E54|nr:hypothetical protein N0V96_010935 [Colletotrichum fioriniae]
MRNSIALSSGLARLSTPQTPRRSFVTTAAKSLAAATSCPASAPPLNPRWLSELQSRIKRCAGLDLSGQQKEELTALRKAVDGQMQCSLPEDTMNLNLTSIGHVNNVVYNKYAESARVNWLRNFATTVDPEHKHEWDQLMSPKGIGLIMRSIKTDYKFVSVTLINLNQQAFEVAISFSATAIESEIPESPTLTNLLNLKPMAYPDHVTVLHKLASKPTYESDFILLEALLISDGHRRPAARCFEDIVVYDYKTAKRAPLKPFMVDRLRETYEAQEQSKIDCEKKIKGLVDIVERLEKAA